MNDYCPDCEKQSCECYEELISDRVLFTDDAFTCNSDIVYAPTITNSPEILAIKNALEIVNNMLSYEQENHNQEQLEDVKRLLESIR